MTTKAFDNFQDRLQKERDWTEEVAEAVLNGEDHMEWLALRSSHRFLAEIGQSLYLWEYIDGEPLVIETFFIHRLYFDAVSGFEAELESSNKDLDLIVIGHYPEKLTDGVFLWLPYHNDIQVLPAPSDRASGEYLIKFALVQKTAAHPKSKQEGVFYLTDDRMLALCAKDS